MPTPELKTLSDTIRGLLEATSDLRKDAPRESELEAIVARGEFRPAEDEAIGYWFARFLSVRESLWAVIQMNQSSIDFDYVKYRDHNYQKYLHYKEVLV